MIWDLKINLELRSKLFVSASCCSGLTGECDPLEAGLVVLSAAVKNVVSITGCQVGSLPDLSLQTALVCALDFISQHSLCQGPQLLHQLAVGGDGSSPLLDDLWRVRISGSAGLEIWWENVLSGLHI